MFEGEECPYCFNETVYVDSSEIYGKSYGMIYLCRPCMAWVGVHKGTNKAKGRLANNKLRKMKKKAHKYFDNLWERKMLKDDLKQKEARNKAYNWLSEKTGIDRKICHIGMMDIEQCNQVIEICKPYFKNKE